uniref:Uncharacterized protein n=1 Tax=Tanacetum cinerariifolium TaxID=118510 RepID=A0A699GHV4_TANCI|nr:hypothetical protein [Tanacetum cinerariifolium]
MSRRLFTKIVREVTDASQFFKERYDCTGQRSISALMKCTFAVRQLAYGCVPDSLDEYLQMGATTARDSLRIFWRAPDVPFVANDMSYERGYYLTDGIYPQWSVLIKSIKNPEEQHRADDPNGGGGLEMTRDGELLVVRTSVRKVSRMLRNLSVLKEFRLEIQFELPSGVVFVKREFPSVDEPDPQPLPDLPFLDVNLGGKRGTDLPINPYSPGSFRMKVVEPLTIHTPHSPYVAYVHQTGAYRYYHPYLMVICDEKKLGSSYEVSLDDSWRMI